MSKIAFIYPGQGAQKAGMGADFYEKSEIAREIFDQASDALNLDMKALCFEENEKLDITEYTQAALVTTCLAMTRVVEKRGLTPDCTAGLSLGEYCAIAVAGGMKDLDAIRLVRKRGILMQNTVPAGVGAMCAVMAMDAEEIERVIEDIDGVTIANYNCPGQIVITGKKEAVEEAAERLKEAGAKRECQRSVSFTPSGSCRRRTCKRTGAHRSVSAESAICDQCDCFQSRRYYTDQSTFGRAGKFSGTLDAEYGGYGRRWRRYICRDWTGKNTGRFYEKD